MVPEGPPVSVGQHEEPVSPERVPALSCTEAVRAVAGNLDGIIWASESVTRDSDYGHIYRYDIDTVVNDEAGGVRISRGRVVISALDSERIVLSCHSVFDLP